MIEERNPRRSNIAASRECPVILTPLGVLRWLFVRSVATGGETEYLMDCDFRAFGRIRMQFRLKKPVIVLALCAFGSCMFAQQSAKPAARGKQSLFKAQHFEQAAISPDGKRV